MKKLFFLWSAAFLLVIPGFAVAMDECKEAVAMSTADEVDSQVQLDDFDLVAGPTREALYKKLYDVLDSMPPELINIILDYRYSSVDKRLVELLPPTNKRLVIILGKLLILVPMDVIKTILAYRSDEFKGEQVAAVNEFRGEDIRGISELDDEILRIATDDHTFRINKDNKYVSSSMRGFSTCPHAHIYKDIYASVGNDGRVFIMRNDPARYDQQVLWISFEPFSAPFGVSKLIKFHDKLAVVGIDDVYARCHGECPSQIKVFDFSGKQLGKTITTTGNPSAFLSEKIIASVWDDPCTIVLLDLEKGSCLKQFPLDPTFNRRSGLAMVSDNGLLAIGGRLDAEKFADKKYFTLILVDPIRENIVRRVDTEDYAVTALAALTHHRSNGATVVTGSDRGVLKFWR